MICDRRLSACAEGKVYKTVVGLAMPYNHTVYGDSTIDQETKSRGSSGTVEDVKIFFGSYENGQN